MSSASTTKDSNRITKRTRPVKDTNDTPQKARKRALDREAQRTFREKTKNYITHLEQTVRICETESGSLLIKKLLEQNKFLFSRIEDLRKILTDIHVATEPEISRGASKPRPNADDAQLLPSQQQPDRSSSIAENRMTPILEPIQTLSNSASGQLESGSTPMAQVSCPDVATLGNLSLELENDTGSETLNSFNNEMDTFLSHQLWTLSSCNNTQDKHDMAGLNGPPDCGEIVLDIAGIGRTFTDINLPVQLSSDIDGGLYAHLSTMTNIIYTGIFDISLPQGTTRHSHDVSTIFKGIKTGWETLHEMETNPIIRVLSSYDALVASHLDQVNRVAIALKNYTLINYLINPDMSILESMPWWQRPRSSQRRKEIPIAIHFFAWPGFRDRLSIGDTRIFREHEKFTEAYLKNFHFLWPFSFDDAFRCCPATGLYSPTPLFERYHRDLTCWSMQKNFFLDYPEFFEDICLGQKV